MTSHPNAFDRRADERGAWRTVLAFVVPLLVACADKPDAARVAQALPAGWTPVAAHDRIDMYDVFERQSVASVHDALGARDLCALGNPWASDHRGQVSVLDTSSGGTLSTWIGPELLEIDGASWSAGFGAQVVWVPDLDADGVPDLLATTMPGEMSALSVGTGVVLWRASVGNTTAIAIANQLDADATPAIWTAGRHEDEVCLRRILGATGRVDLEVDPFAEACGEVSFESVRSLHVFVDPGSEDPILAAELRVPADEHAGAAPPRLWIARFRASDARLVTCVDEPLVGGGSIAGAFLVPSAFASGTELLVVTESTAATYSLANCKRRFTRPLDPIADRMSPRAGPLGDVDGDAVSDYWRSAEGVVDTQGEPFATGRRLWVHSGATGQPLYSESSTIWAGFCALSGGGLVLHALTTDSDFPVARFHFASH